MISLFSIRKYTFFSLLIVCAFSRIYAQNIKGKVLNEDGKYGIPFAVIVIDKSNRGTTTDIDGNFDLALTGSEREITIQVIGYYKKTIELATLDLSKPQIIKLKTDNISLMEVVITPKENPADILIKKVIKNKPTHDINNLKYYFCTTYAKTYFTLADKSGDEYFYNQDTVKYKKLKQYLERSYFFFMESVTEKKYLYKNKSQEKVLSSRVSGFKSAPFGSFASQLQSFTFYKDNIELLGVKYLSPVIPGTLKRYRFEIADTVYTGTDTTILVKFSPKKGVKFKALKGMLYINKNDYALCNVLAEPAEIAKDGTGIRIQQLYEKIDSKAWFPRQVNTEILFNSVNISPDESAVKGGTIMKGVSKMYIKEIKLDSVIKIKNKSLEVYNAKDYADKDEKFWNQYRTDSLTKRELRTYEMIDSVGKELKLDQKLKWFTALTTGQWQVGYFNFDLKHILRINEYEAARLGLGLSTSNKLSRWFSVGGYGGYGFRDKAFKYGGHLRLNFSERQTTFLLAEAASEVVETAGTSFTGENSSFISTQKIRDLLISQMDKVNYAKLSFNTPIINAIKTSVYMKVEERTSPFGYYYDLNLPVETKKFTLNEAGIQFRYWPKEKFIESMGRLISAGSKWPIFSLNVAKGLTEQIDVYKGDFDYTKVDLRIDHQLNFKVKGFIAYQIQAGKVFGNVPYSVQYNNKGSKAKIFSVSAEKTFETMYLNEFISTEYAAFFFSLNFGKIIKPNKKFNPELELMHNYGIGNLSNRENLTMIELNDISKGYAEAGVRIKNIIRSNFSTFGAGVFYRYGNYASDQFEKNFTYKIVLGISL